MSLLRNSNVGIKIQLCVADIVAMCSYPEIGLSTCGLGLSLDLVVLTTASACFGVLASFNITGRKCIMSAIDLLCRLFTVHPLLE